MNQIYSWFVKVPKIEVIVRHCIASDASAHKKRFSRFSRQACHQNLLDTIDRKRANITYFLDVAKGVREEHFLKDPVVEISAGTEAGSFLSLLDYVEKKQFSPETILYFVEDDYLHRPQWVDVLLEGFKVPGVDYVTLYDHRDKYFLPQYADLRSKIFVTPSCHWRETPSTTQTFAVLARTFLADLSIHRQYSTGRSISADHEKFCHLMTRGRRLISSIPGWSAHAEPDFASPCIDWERYFHKENV